MGQPIDLRACVEATRRFDVPVDVSGGAEGYIEVRRAPIWMVNAMTRVTKMEDFRELVAALLVEPKVRFPDPESGLYADGPDLRWDDLPVPFIKFVAESISSFSAGSSPEVDKAAATFRGPGQGGDTGGDPGAVRAEDRGAADAAERSAVVVNGADHPVL